MVSLQVSQSPYFITYILNQTSITETEYQLTDLAEDTTYYWRVSMTDETGTSRYSDTWSFITSGGTTWAEEETSTRPQEFTLSQNYPNPFNPLTTIHYALPRSTHVTLEVFNLLGEKVTVLADGLQDAGYHRVLFDAQGLPSGMYFYRLQAGDFVETKKLLLLR